MISCQVQKGLMAGTSQKSKIKDGGLGLGTEGWGRTECGWQKTVRVEGQRWTNWKWARQIAHNGRAGLRTWDSSLVSRAVEAAPKHAWVTSEAAFSPGLWQGLRTR